MGSEMMFLGQKQQEKMKSTTNFTQTCNRFSQFLKERRSHGHLDAFKSFASSELQTKGNKDASEAKRSSAKMTLEKERTSLELFPLTNSHATAAEDVENSTKNISDFRELPKSKEESENTTSNSPSMTIFYGGRVLVFDELPKDKAQEIMSLVASHGTMSLPSHHTQAQTETQTLTARNISASPAHQHLTRDMVSQGASNLSDMPIARRVSLHRFMEKRKHRLAASAPYQFSNSSMAKEANCHQPKLNDMMRSLYEQQQLELKL